MKTRILSLALALLAGQAAAQPTLKTLFEAAEQHNVDQRVSAEQLNQAEAAYRQAWTGLLPSLTASGNWTNNQFEAVANFGGNELVIVPKNQLDATLRFELPLIDVGRWMRSAAAGQAQEAAAARQEQTRDAIHRQVASVWFNYAASVALVTSAQRSFDVAVAQLKLQEIRSQAGTVTELELLRSRAEVERTKQTIADAKSLVATTRRSLRTLTGLDPGEAAALPADDLSPEPGVEQLEGNLEGLPAVRAADYDAAGTEKLASNSRLSLVPTVTANFTQRFTNATGFQGAAAVYSAGVGFTWRLDVPTFQVISVSSAQAAQAQLASERARLNAKDQVFGDWQRLEAARVKVVAAAAQVQAAQRASQVSRDRYDVGAATQVDVIQAERDLFSAEVGQIQARTELASARVALRISAGLPLGLN